MPANLSPEYKDAQEAYRKARDPHERLVTEDVVPELVRHDRGEAGCVQHAHVEIEVALPIPRAHAQIRGGLDRDLDARQAVCGRRRVGEALDLGDLVLLLRRQRDAAGADGAERQDEPGHDGFHPPTVGRRPRHVNPGVSDRRVHDAGR